MRKILLIGAAALALAACSSSPGYGPYYGSNYAPYDTGYYGYGSSVPPARSCSPAGGLIGGLAGAAGGGLLGNQIGHGTGKSVATGLGVVGGGAAGYEAGRSLSGC